MSLKKQKNIIANAQCQKSHALADKMLNVENPTTLKN